MGSFGRLGESETIAAKVTTRAGPARASPGAQADIVAEHRPPRTRAACRRRRDRPGVRALARLRRAPRRDDPATLRRRAFDRRAGDRRLRGEGSGAPPAPVALPGSAAAADALNRAARLRPRADPRRSRPGC